MAKKDLQLQAAVQLFNACCIALRTDRSLRPHLFCIQAHGTRCQRLNSPRNHKHRAKSKQRTLSTLRTERIVQSIADFRSQRCTFFLALQKRSVEMFTPLHHTVVSAVPGADLDRVVGVSQKVSAACASLDRMVRFSNYCTQKASRIYGSFFFPFSPPSHSERIE